MSRLEDLLREELRLTHAHHRVGDRLRRLAREIEDELDRAAAPARPALVENLALSVRSPQDGPEPEDDAPAGPTSGLPVCTCPPCLAERASGRRP
ncbi:MAG: hypothetical protein KBB14_06250 [Thermoanaerobaculia bacterium]|nr:hypothetical protein [Thermoanaerobaculia bacterium]